MSFPLYLFLTSLKKINFLYYTHNICFNNITYNGFIYIVLSVQNNTDSLSPDHTTEYIGLSNYERLLLKFPDFDHIFRLPSSPAVANDPPSLLHFNAINLIIIFN